MAFNFVDVLVDVTVTKAGEVNYVDGGQVIVDPRKFGGHLVAEY